MDLSIIMLIMVNNDKNGCMREAAAPRMKKRTDGASRHREMDEMDRFKSSIICNFDGAIFDVFLRVTLFS